MKNIKKYDKFVNESKLDDQLKNMFDEGDGKYYTTISFDNTNSTIDLDFMKQWHENREQEDEDDGEDFQSFYKLYKKNKYKRVISAVCGGGDITVYKSGGDAHFKINDENIDIDFIRKNFINTNDDVIFGCGDGFDEDIVDFLYRGRLYERIYDKKYNYQKHPNHIKQLLIDIINDMEK